MRDVRLLRTAFNPGDLVGSFKNAHPGSGGTCSFVGEVRADKSVLALELSHYEPLTMPGMEKLADAAIGRFSLLGLLMVHRVGLMQPSEPIVCVSAAAAHRREAIDAVDYCMDHLKSRTWFWKREQREDGWHWIEPRCDDHEALARWQ